MYLVALCDDEQAELDKIQALLEKYSGERPKREFVVECFENAETFFSRIHEEVYEPDLILLDIFMHEKTGIEAARELRGMGVKSRIAFLTSSTDYALEAFEVDAMQYLVKPVSEMSIFGFPDKVFESIERERKRYVLLKVDNTVRRIMVNSVVCCESQRKKSVSALFGWHKPLSAYDNDRAGEAVRPVSGDPAAGKQLYHQSGAHRHSQFP